MKISLRSTILVAAVLVWGCSGLSQQDDHAVLVSTRWLQEHLEDPSLVILHVGERASFDTIHIPGSQYIHPGALVVNTHGLRNEIPDAEKIDSVLVSKGIRKHSRVVLCYENESFISRTARIFLTMEYAGLGTQAHLLNGGLERWMEEGRSVTDTVYAISTGELQPEENPRILVDAGEVDARRGDPGYIVIDARSSSYYEGYYDTINGAFVGGHIEGAVNLPYGNLLSDTVPYMFMGNEEMRNAFERTGMEEGNILIHSCGSGIAASVTYLVARHLGYRSMFYDGSFEDWRNRGLATVPSY
jgi:thiosulfate/3-mercaptopyruvate sulfurtransferase